METNEKKTAKKEPNDRMLMFTMLGVIVSIWAVFLLQVVFQVKAAKEEQIVPMLEMSQVMSDVDAIFTGHQAEIIHYVYDNTGAVTVKVDPYNSNVWYIDFVVDMDAGGTAGIAYSYTQEKGWEAWDWGCPEPAHLVSPIA